MEQEGLKINIPVTTTPKELFEMFFDGPLFDKICNWVNLRAQMLKDKTVSRHAAIKNWKQRNPSEIRRFLGLCFIMANISMPSLKQY